MSVWLAILAAGLGSYLFRLSMVVLADRVTMPEKLERASTFVAPAAFAALAAGGIAANTAERSLERSTSARSFSCGASPLILKLTRICS